MADRAPGLIRVLLCVVALTLPSLARSGELEAGLRSGSRSLDPAAPASAPREWRQRDSAAAQSVPAPAAPRAPEPEAAGDQSSGCPVPPDGRWHVYPMGIALPWQGFFDPRRDRFIVPQANEPELQVLSFSATGGSWRFLCADGQPPVTISAQALDLPNDRAFYLGSGPLTEGEPNSWGVW